MRLSPSSARFQRGEQKLAFDDAEFFEQPVYRTIGLDQALRAQMVPIDCMNRSAKWLRRGQASK